MLADVYSCAVLGLQGALVSIEVDIGSGLPNLTVVGLPDTAVQEAKERVRAAIKNSGCLFPNRRVTVNMAPADLRKAGPSYDLPIAVGILLASGQVEPPRERSVFLGELGLDGSLRHTNGVLPMVALAAEQRFETVYVPSDDAREAALLGSVRVMPVRTLGELAAHLRGDDPIRPYVSDGFVPPSAPPPVYVDMSEIKGQEHVKRALEIAASGHHNVLTCGTQRLSCLRVRFRSGRHNGLSSARYSPLRKRAERPMMADSSVLALTLSCTVSESRCGAFGLCS